MPDEMVVAGLCGSLREGSFTRMALAVALRGAAQAGAHTHLLDLRDYELVFAGREGQPAAPGVARLQHDVKQADGIILATPEYHGSFSGVLKNALDLMGFEEFEGKMLGLVGVSGGPLGAAHALNSLRVVGRALHAWVVPEQAGVPEAWKHFDEAGRMKDKDLEERLLTVGRQVARFARLHKCEAGEFLKRWEEAPLNPGG
jgi:NAD(P)H-dependent FMN reductase